MSHDQTDLTTIAERLRNPVAVHALILRGEIALPEVYTAEYRRNRALEHALSEARQLLANAVSYLPGDSVTAQGFLDDARALLAKTEVQHD
jgi:hypothetical protein